MSSGYCVKECPTGPGFKLECAAADAAACASTASVPFVYTTYNLFGYCFPNPIALKKNHPELVAHFNEEWNLMLSSNAAGRGIQDISKSSTALYTSIALSFVYSILFIYLMSWFAEYIAWGIIVLVQLGLIGGAIFCFGEYTERKHAATGSAG